MVALQPVPAQAINSNQLLFLEAWRAIDRAYVDKTFNDRNWFKLRQDALNTNSMNSTEETYTAIREMLKELDDPFTRFLSPEEFATTLSSTRNSLSGVGLEVTFNAEGECSVVTPISGGPADDAGLRPGDIILSIDGSSVADSSLYSVAQALQGPPGSSVDVVLRRADSGQEEAMTLRRRAIQLSPVKSALCSQGFAGQDSDDKVGYIRLSRFSRSSAKLVGEALEDLKSKGASKYVLDMRNNGGGNFPEGVEVAKTFLNEGVIVYITDSVGVRDVYEASGEAIEAEMPLSILVNKGTASASEVVAGALRDNGRAVIVGEGTYGKGLIQSLLPLSDGSAVAVTVAKYETPARLDINKVGIKTDRELSEELPMSDPQGFCRAIRNSEADLESELFGPVDRSDVDMDFAEFGDLDLV